MLKISPINFNNRVQSKSNRGYLGITAPSRDTVSFGSTMVGSCPKELLNVPIAQLNKASKNVLEVCDLGYLAEIIKYFSPETKKTYAIKRAWSNDKVKQAHVDQIEHMKQEAEIYAKLGHISNIPKFHFYKGNFAKSENSALDNYLIMSWTEGKNASKSGIFYDKRLVNPNTIKKTYKILSEFDKAGVIHNDLWAGNILFTKYNANIIDFNRAFAFNPSVEYKKNNLESFKTRFLNRYLSDVYHESGKRGERELVKAYRHIVSLEHKYFKDKVLYYKREKNLVAADYYNKEAVKTANLLKDSELLKRHALLTVFESNVHCAEIFAKHFEFGKDEAGFHLEKALEVIDKNGHLIPKPEKKLILSNLAIFSQIKEAVESPSGLNHFSAIKIKRNLANMNIYNFREREKPYFIMLNRFCDFAAKKRRNPSANFREEFADLYDNKRLYQFLNNLEA